MKINDTVFELNVIYRNMTQGHIWLMIASIRESHKSLIEAKVILFKNKVYGEIDSINTQLAYMELNIRTLEDALLAHESKILEKRPSLEDLKEFWLN